MNSFFINLFLLCLCLPYMAYSSNIKVNDPTNTVYGYLRIYNDSKDNLLTLINHTHASTDVSHGDFIEGFDSGDAINIKSNKSVTLKYAVDVGVESNAYYCTANNSQSLYWLWYGNNNLIGTYGNMNACLNAVTEKNKIPEIGVFSNTLLNLKLSFKAGTDNNHPICISSYNLSLTAINKKTTKFSFTLTELPSKLNVNDFIVRIPRYQAQSSIYINGVLTDNRSCSIGDNYIFESDNMIVEPKDILLPTTSIHINPDISVVT